jgi:hypothetical protein
MARPAREPDTVTAFEPVPRVGQTRWLTVAGVAAAATILALCLALTHGTKRAAAAAPREEPVAVVPVFARDDVTPAPPPTFTTSAAPSPPAPAPAPKPSTSPVRLAAPRDAGANPSARF